MRSPSPSASFARATPPCTGQHPAEVAGAASVASADEVVAADRMADAVEFAGVVPPQPATTKPAARIKAAARMDIVPGHFIEGRAHLPPPDTTRQLPLASARGAGQGPGQVDPAPVVAP